MNNDSRGMIISVHVPKTAGKAFANVLEAHFGDLICYDYGDQYQFTDPVAAGAPTRLRRWARNLRWRQRLRDSDRCIHGHFQARKYRERFPEARFVAWVRDPVERVTSQYYHWQRNPDHTHSICRRLLREQLSLEAFAALPSMRNLQTKYLEQFGVDDFWFLGIQEHFDHMLQVFQGLLGSSAYKPLTIGVNPAKSTNARYEMPAETWSVLDELNSEDRLFYRQAVARAVEEGLLADDVVGMLPNSNAPS